MNIRRFLGITFTALLILSLPGYLYGAVIEKNFFSVELPADWKISVENEDRYVAFTSPVLENSAAMLAITTAKVPSLSSEEFLDMHLKAMKDEGINIGIPKKTNEGYYIVPILTKLDGFILAGIKDGFADSITVFGFHPELANVLRSLHVLKERPYLSSMTVLALSNVVNTVPPNSSQK